MRSRLPREERQRSSDQHAEDSYVKGGPVNGRAPDSSANQRQPHVRRRTATITDGPFAETKELLGGWTPPASARR
ncbi:MAG TPA: hypothetical protein VGQ56_13975 [Gemmatimonadaceae bacterium]|jgi:hypothetical protein|nr:hypothetical protein [Gemmatimonadaceae bacterium]